MRSTSLRRLPVGLGLMVAMGVLYVGYVAIWGRLDSNAASGASYFNDIVTPLLAFVSFFALLITVVIQSNELGLAREELQLTRHELERSADALHLQSESLSTQNFQQVALQLLGLHMEISQRVTCTVYNPYGEEKQQAYGAAAFYELVNRLGRQIKEKKRRAKKTRSERQISLATYNRFYRVNADQLAHYFRFLYRTLKFLNDNSHRNDIYVKLLRAQLSDDELLILFYNGLTPRGRKFGTLMEQTALLNNLPKKRLPSSLYLGWYQRSVFGDEPPRSA